MTEIIGVTFPIPKEYMSKFFKGGKTVFIKPASLFKDLKIGMKMVFYQSHEDTGFIGEATIKKIVIMDDPLNFFDIFGDSIFLERDEVEEYLSGLDKWKNVRVRKGEEKKKKWIALELDNIREYENIKKPNRFVPVGGMYLRE